ncbi:ankyrin repeat domain-containing protein 17-like [Haliotis cracherodii]|uniref:ankyrin repeat domain-containing protein 17-like n=1 Tax=Haliotis cracherodii TaxID=6455 RepID=UPI0039ED5325
MSGKHPERATEPEHHHRDSESCERQDGVEDVEHINVRLPGLMDTLNLEESIGLPTRADGGHDTAQGTHGDETMDNPSSSDVVLQKTGHDDDVSVVPQGTHGDETFTMDNPASSDVVLQQTGHDDDVSVVPQGTQGDETFTMDNPASSDVVVPQGTHGGETFSMDMVAATEVVERQARSGNSAMAVSERRVRQAVSTRITAGPDLRGTFGKDSSYVILSLGGQNAGIMKSDLLKIKIKRVKDVFVKTAIYKRVKEKLEKYGHVTISGASGEGKTATALLVGADFRKQGYQLVFVDDVDTFKLDNCELCGKKVCLILDDIFGTVGLSTDVPHLRSILQNLEHYLEDIQYNKAEQQETRQYTKSMIRVIFTTKSYNLECGIAKLEGQEFYFFSGPSLLDLTKMKSCHYSHEERKRILQKHLQYHNVKLELDIDTICDTTESMFGFPLTCKLFCKFLSFQKEPAQFFREPLFYLRRELDMIMERRDDQSAALILMLLCKDNVNLSQVEMESENIILEAYLQAVKSVVTITTRTAVAKAARCYRGTFLTAGDIIGFSHPTIYDACACALFNMNPSFVLKHCSIRFLYERVQAQEVESTTIDDHLHIIYLSNVYNDAIASRLAEAIGKGNYSKSITHPILKREQIVDKVFQKLKLRKPNTLERWLNTEDNKRLRVLHAKEEEKHLLYWAVQAHSLYLVERIIEVGYQFSEEEIIEAFEACASCGNESVLLFLSSKYRTLFHQNMLNKALVIATEHNYKGVVSALLELGADGADLTLTDDDNNNVLHAACLGGNRFIVERLLPLFDINCRGREGVTGVMIAAFCGKKDTFEMLVSKGADLALTIGFNNNVLHLACEVGNRFIVERLLPFFDFNCRGREGLTGVMIAALYGKKDTFEMLVAKGADLTLTNDFNNNVLHLACQGGNRFIVERLLPLFDINCRGHHGWTGVMRASLYGQKDTFEMLVSKGADLALTDDYNNNVLHLACQVGNRLIVERLLLLFDINCRGREGLTGVMIAALCGKKDTFEMLVSKGADLTLTNDYNNNVLHLACQGGNRFIVERLLPFIDINCRGQEGLTGVMISALCGKKDTFEMLVSKGADLTLTNDVNNNVLHLACQGGNRFIVERLLPFIDINCRGREGLTGIMIAALCEKKDTFEMVVSRGADLTLTNDYNSNVLHLACQGGNRFIVERLLPFIDINCRGREGLTGVMIAAFCGKKDTFEMLVSKGEADLTLTDDYNNNVLHLACQGGNRFIVERLLPLFDINCRGREGSTGVLRAALYGKKDTFEMLVSKGADLTLTTDNNNNVLHLACQGGNRSIVERLLPLFDINCRGNEGLTGVMRAAFCGKRDSFEMLMSKGADLTLTDDYNSNVLHLACQGGNRFIVERLLPLFDINCRGREGLTGVMMAALYGKKDTFEMLMSKGADLTLTDDNNNNVLHLACQGGNRFILERLLPLFDINCRRNEGWTGVMMAVLCGKKDTFEMLVSAGADLTLTDDFNNNVLLLACEGGNRFIVERLLSLFDINCQGQHCFTGAMRAAFFGKRDSFEMLMSKGADLTLTDDYNNNVLHLACQGGNRFILQRLLPLFDINCRGNEGWTGVMMAVLCGKKDTFEMLVSAGTDLTLTDDYNNNVLHLACEGGNRFIVERLLPLFDINCRGQHCLTGVMIAALYGKKDTFEMLVSKGADLTLTDEYNNNVLHLACQGGNMFIVERLLPLFDINCRGQHCLTGVMIAALYGKKDTFEMLASKGADLTLANDYNNNVLHLACQGGNRFIVELLLPFFDINCRGVYGCTPFMRAAWSGKNDVLFRILRSGGNRLLVGDNNHTVLHAASKGGNMTIVEDVIDLFDINTRGVHGCTPLLEAARGGHMAVVDFLVSRKADVKMVDNSGNSLLHAACFYVHLGMVKHVCPWYNIDDRNLHGWTPAMVAAVFGKQSVFDYLKQKGADLTLVDKTGDGVFTLALQGGCRQIIEQLSPDGQHVKKPSPWNELMRSIVTGLMYRLKIYDENSPDPVQTDQFGDSLLHLACRGGNRQCVEYLLPSYDINVRGRYDWMPAMMAAVCGHDDVFQLLVSHKADLSLVSDTGENILSLAQRGRSDVIVKYLRDHSGQGHSR